MIILINMIFGRAGYRARMYRVEDQKSLTVNGAVHTVYYMFFEMFSSLLIVGSEFS